MVKVSGTINGISNAGAHIMKIPRASLSLVNSLMFKFCAR